MAIAQFDIALDSGLERGRKQILHDENHEDYVSLLAVVLYHVEGMLVISMKERR